MVTKGVRRQGVIGVRMRPEEVAMFRQAAASMAVTPSHLAAQVIREWLQRMRTIIAEEEEPRADHR